MGARRPPQQHDPPPDDLPAGPPSTDGPLGSSATATSASAGAAVSATSDMARASNRLASRSATPFREPVGRGRQTRTMRWRWAGSVAGKSWRVWAPRLSVRCRGGGDQGAGDVDQVGDLVARSARWSRRPTRRRRWRPPRRPPRPARARPSASRSTPAPASSPAGGGGGPRPSWCRPSRRRRPPAPGRRGGVGHEAAADGAGGDGSALGVAAEHGPHGAGGLRRRPCPARWPRPPGGRTPCPRAASSTPGGWRRGRPCTATSPAAHRPGSDVAPSRSVTTPPHSVVGGRGDGQPVRGRVEADLARARRRWSGTAASKSLEAGGVEPDVVDALLEHARGHRPGDTTSRGSSSSTKRSPLASRSRAPWPRSASDSSGRGIARVVQRGRVELDELDVGDGHAGPQRHGDAVAGGLDRVGGDREQLAGAAGGEQHVGGPHLDAAAVGVEGGDARGSGRPRRSGRGRSGARSTAAAVRLHGLDQRPLDLGAGGGAAGVHDAGQASGRPRGPARARPCGVAVEHGAEGDELVDPARPLVDQHPHGVDVAQPGAGGEGVGQVEVGGVGVVAPSTAATPPWAQRVVAWCSSPLVSTPTRMPCVSAARTAADSPATPLPRTSRSRSSSAIAVDRSDRAGVRRRPSRSSVARPSTST